MNLELECYERKIQTKKINDLRMFKLMSNQITLCALNFYPLSLSNQVFIYVFCIIKSMTNQTQPDNIHSFGSRNGVVYIDERSYGMHSIVLRCVL